MIHLYRPSRRISFVRVEKIKGAQVPTLFSEVPKEVFCKVSAGVARVASWSH
jgi:hypothetical protein